MCLGVNYHDMDFRPGAPDRTRTGTGSRPRDFKSRVSAIPPLGRVVPSCLPRLGTGERCWRSYDDPEERRAYKKGKLTLLSSSIFIITYFCLSVKFSFVAEVNGSAIINQILRSFPFFLGSTKTAEANRVFSALLKP